ncbi:hypothetical protein Tco_1086631 [Tanacetum coccineum]
MSSLTNSPDHSSQEDDENHRISFSESRHGFDVLLTRLQRNRTRAPLRDNEEKSYRTHMFAQSKGGFYLTKNEKRIADFLYTCQYQMPGILAISLDEGRPWPKFYEQSFNLGVLKDHVTPYCHELTYFDYESEVEDDILPIFRKGEEFNFGVEFILLLAFKESSLGEVVDDALTSFSKLLMEFPSLIVQATKGSNFNPGSKDYTHAIVIRFRSCELCFQSMTFKLFTFASFITDDSFLVLPQPMHSKFSWTVRNLKMVTSQAILVHGSSVCLQKACNYFP